MAYGPYAKGEFARLARLQQTKLVHLSMGLQIQLTAWLHPKSGTGAIAQVF
ncbi:MAG: hypothetical protein ACI92S_000289 [Planctomycetaceae bacterium]|jgi:hypothetical protein